jgi:outer membrane immunogenic protein
MKIVVLGVLCVALAFEVPAGAADLRVPAVKAPPVDPIHNWTGFYAGGHFGYLWGRTRVEDDGVLTESGALTNGVIGGAVAGANLQTGPLVLGLEADLGWTNAHGNGAAVITTVTTTQAPNTYDFNWTSHFRGRAGYASGQWLLFVSGGLAIADFDFHEGAITTTRSVVAVAPGGKYTGWSIGGGLEYAFTQQIAGRLEYLFDDFGHKNYTGFDGGIYRVGLTGQTLRAVATWKF